MARILNLNTLVENELDGATERVLGTDDVLLFHVSTGQAALACEHGLEIVDVVRITFALEAPEQGDEDGGGAWSTGTVQLPLGALLDPEGLRNGIGKGVQELVFARQAASLTDGDQIEGQSEGGSSQGPPEASGA